VKRPQVRNSNIARWRKFLNFRWQDLRRRVRQGAILFLVGENVQRNAALVARAAQWTFAAIVDVRITFVISSCAAKRHARSELLTREELTGDETSVR
jgi:hypothetical protein